MAKRSQNARDEQGTWDVGCGGLKWGSSLEDNVRREVREEYGADAMQIALLGFREVFRKLTNGELTHWISFDYAALIEPEQVRNNEPEMIDEVGWFSLNNLPSPLHSQLPVYFEKNHRAIESLLGDLSSSK